MLCKTEAALNITSKKMFEWINVLVELPKDRDCEIREN